ncbi:MAG: helix-turn-helix domain-containing protein [Spirochaetia bacterium]|nr:helix-turn-helix domain-containing protein [Spirochaetia bacterium]MCI5607835.1 helix-turn-helix domain-containing protein [Spirochaetia bacterium]
MNGNEIFAERVKAEREKKGLSATELAEKFNIQKTRVSMWETNGTVPRQDMLMKLCDFFNVSVDYLLGYDRTDGKNPKNETISSIQRGLDKLSATDLQTAQNILKAAFKDAFGGV